jgi:hypothetical protein
MSGAGPAAPPTTPLELRVEALSLELEALRQRVDDLEHGAPQAVHASAAATAAVAPSNHADEALITLPLVGRTFLVLGGA